MLLLHMQEIVFVDSQEGLLSSRGGRGGQTYWHQAYTFNLELATARQTFFSNLINSNLNNTRTLFSTVERLTNPPKSDSQ